LVVLTRYHSPKGFHYSGTPKVAAPAGFTAEGALGSLLAKPAADAVKFYACKMKTTDDHFSSLDQSGKYEGQTVVALLGYVYADKPAGIVTVPLFRCNSGNSHFDSLHASCENTKYIKEGPLGFLVSASG